MSSPQQGPQQDSEKDWFPNQGMVVPPKDPEMPEPGTPAYEQMMEGREDQTEAARQFIKDLQRLSEAP